jgi:hypothetical protein
MPGGILMVEKATVSSIGDGTAKVILINKDNIVTPELSVAQHVGLLAPGDIVVVTFFEGYSDGAIIGKV